MAVTLREATAADANRCGIVCYDAFTRISAHHNFPPDVPSVEMAQGLIAMCLAHPKVYGVVAELEGQIVGSNFFWERDAVGGIGPITVDPRAQNHSIGRSLMEHVLARAESGKFAAVRLVQAAFHSRSLSLYTKLGFDVREPLATIQGPPLKKQTAGFAVRAATAEDAGACNALCFRIHGHTRDGELRDAVGHGTATVVERGGRITGYASIIGFFGHAVAESNDDLKALIAAAPEFAGPGFLLPTRNGELFRWCLEQGLRVTQPMTLMSRGLYNGPHGAFLPSILF